MKLFFLILSISAILSVSAKAETDLQLEKRLSADYLNLMAKEKDAVVIDQGIVLRPIFKSPSTIYPKAEDTVHVSYYLTNREGALIEESISSDEDLSFPLNKLIKCWQIAVTKMSVGSAYKVTCPSDAAYGDRGAGADIKPGAALTFRITLFGI